MRLNIKSKNDVSFDCVDSLVASVAEYWNKNYELMFIESWGFSYKIESDNSTIGSRLNDSRGDSWKNLIKYHGIEPEVIKKDSYLQTIELIKEQLNKKVPVGIYIDTFWCPWDIINYQKNHAVHYLLAVGLEDNGIFCLDYQRAPEGACLPLENFKQAWGNCITFSLKDTVEKIDIYKIINKVLWKIENENTLNNMIQFSMDFRSFNFQYEMEGLGSPFESKIIIQLLKISKSRKGMAKALSLLANLSNEDKLSELSEDMLLSGNIWSSIWGTLTKSYYNNSTEKILEGLCQKIDKVVNLERNIFSKLKTIQLTKDMTQDINRKVVLNNHSLCSEFTYIDLSSYFNNKGFGSITNNTYTPRLTLTGDYFLEDSLLKNEIWKVEGMEFKFPYVFNKEKDNVYFNNQLISIEPKSYSKLMLLGCSDLGSALENIEILYEDGFKEEISIGFSSWIAPKPQFNEKIAWSGKRVFRVNEDEITEDNIKVHLYAKEYELKHCGKVKEIKLLQCSNAHLFALTLAN